MLETYPEQENADGELAILVLIVAYTIRQNTTFLSESFLFCPMTDNKFHEKHRPHLVAWLGLVAVATISGYIAFSSRFYSNGANQTRPTTEKNASRSTVAGEKTGVPVGDTKIVINENPATLKGSPATERKNPATLNEKPTTSAGSKAPLVDTKKEAGLAVALSVNGSAVTTEVSPGSTVYDLMSKLQTEKKLTFAGREFAGLGYLIEEINGVRNNGLAKKYWIYYINGEKAKIGVSAYILKPDDKIGWQFEDDIND